jgi:hypothetical protein
VDWFLPLKINCSSENIAPISRMHQDRHTHSSLLHCEAQN